MNKLFPIFLLFPFVLNAQVLVSDIYINGGYQFANTEVSTSFVNNVTTFLQNPIGSSLIQGYSSSLDSIDQFDPINGYSNIGLGAIISLKQFPILGFDLSAEYLWHEEKNKDVSTIKHFDGINLSWNGDVIGDSILIDTSYNFGFKIDNVAIGLAPQAQFELGKKLYLSVGLGVLANIISINQQGYQLETSEEQMSTSAYSHSANYLAWAFQGKAVAGIKMSDRSNIDLGLKYVSTTLNDLEPKNTFLEVGLPNNSSTPIIPIYKANSVYKNNVYGQKTKLDLSGVNVFLRYRYSFKIK